MNIFTGEFGMLMWDIALMQVPPKNTVVYWRLPKRVRQVLAEGNIDSKSSGNRLVVYRQSWVSSTGTTQFIGPPPDNAWVYYPAKLFRYEVYAGTTLLLQTNDLTQALNFQP